MSEDDFTGLNFLVERGDHKAVERYIVDKEIQPAAYYEYVASHHVYSAVGLAAMHGHLDVVKTLLRAGFKQDEKSFNLPIRPIHLACERGNIAIVKLLVEEYGVDICHPDNVSYRPALSYALSFGRLNVVKYFIERGFPVNMKFGDDSVTALHAAAEGDQADMCKYLLSNGAEVDICDARYLTPLMLAASKGRDIAASVLLDAGADVNFTNLKKQTPFLKAAENSHLDMMELLMSRGADPELHDISNMSPLHHAVKDEIEIAYYLVNELNVSVKPPKYYNLTRGESVCSLALRQQRYDIVDLLVNSGYNPSDELAEYENNDRTIRLEGQPRLPLDSLKVKELKQIMSSPRSLIALCIFEIRRLLARRLSTDLCRLPIPKPLQDKIITCNMPRPQSEGSIFF